MPDAPDSGMWLFDLALALPVVLGASGLSGIFGAIAWLVVIALIVAVDRGRHAEPPIVHYVRRRGVRGFR